MVTGLAAALAGVFMSATGASVTVDHGDIVLKGAGPDHQLTSSGHDSDPVLSPDGKTVFFTRTGGPADAMTLCDMNDKPGVAMALWSVSADGSGAAKLLDGHGEQKPEDNLCDFAEKQFSADGSRLYFSTPAWATSGAIHVYDLKAKTEKFFIAGNSLQVLADCQNADYRNDIIASQHRYFVFGGSYDWLYLFKPDGTEVGPVGEKADATMIEDACGAR